MKVPYKRGGETRLVVASKWPISVTSPLPMYLSQYADEFIAAKKDPRFPRSGRPTSQLKQFWFLSRVLAGALYGIKPRTPSISWDPPDLNKVLRLHGPGNRRGSSVTESRFEWIEAT